MRLNHRKLLKRRFHMYLDTPLGASKDTPSLKFALRYNELYLWDPVCREIAAGRPVPDSLSYRYVMNDAVNRAIHTAITCNSTSAFDQIISYGYSFIPSWTVKGMSMVMTNHINTHYNHVTTTSGCWRINGRKSPQIAIYTLFDNNRDIIAIIMNMVGAAGRASACSVSKRMETICLHHSMIHPYPSRIVLYSRTDFDYTYKDIVTVFNDYHLFLRTKQTFGYGLRAIMAIACPEVALHVFAWRNKPTQLDPDEYTSMIFNATVGAFRSANIDVIKHVVSHDDSQIDTLNITASIADAWREYAGGPRHNDVVATLDYYADGFVAHNWLLTILCEYGTVDMVSHLHKKWVSRHRLSIAALKEVYSDCMRASARNRDPIPIVKFLCECASVNIPVFGESQTRSIISLSKNAVELIKLVDIFNWYGMRMPPDMLAQTVIRHDAVTLIVYVDVTIANIKEAIKRGADNILRMLLSAAKLSTRQLNKLTRDACITYENMHALRLLLEHGANYCKCDRPIRDHNINW